MSIRGTVIALLLLMGGSSAHAGLMTGMTFDQDTSSRSMVAEFPSDDEGYVPSFQEPTNSFAAIPASNAFSGVSVATLAVDSVAPVTPDPGYRFSIENDTLPPSPLSRGLMRPS